MSTEIVPPDQTRPAEPAVAPSTSSADRFMRKLLRLPEGKTATADEAHSAFQKSILISAGRCVLMYIFFPFVLPLIGVAKGVGPVIGLIIGTAGHRVDHVQHPSVLACQPLEALALHDLRHRDHRVPDRARRQGLLRPSSR